MTISLSRPVRSDDPPRTYQVRIGKLQKRPKKNGHRYIARWHVGGQPKSLTFIAEPLAEAFLSDLRQAAKAGEDFDLATGLPPSMMVPPPGPTLLPFAQDFLISRWPFTAPRTRETEVYALMQLLAAAVAEHPGPPRADVLRSALRDHALLPAARRTPLTEPQERALRWLQEASLPVTELGKPKVLRPVLAALAVNLDGRPAAPNTLKRRRAILRHLLECAVEQEIFERNPLGKIKLTMPKTFHEVDPRVVVNPSQAQALLDAVARVGATRGARMRALFACMYYAGLRPEEVAGLRLADCSLPPTGWGTILLDGARPQSTRRWTDSGTTREQRQLKHRARKDTRQIPVPFTLVAILREHVAAYGITRDGRIFCTPTGASYGSSACSRVWQEARRLALSPQQQASLLAARPYDLRHAAVSLWLNAGVPAVEVAKRAGHGLDVLLKVYAKCIDGDQNINNAKIQRALD